MRNLDWMTENIAPPLQLIVLNLASVLRLPFTREEKKMKRETELSDEISSGTLHDLNSSEIVEIVSPSEFQLETILIDSAYFHFRGKEYRFLLCKARELGLKIA